MVKKLSITAIGLLWLLFAVGAFAKAPSRVQSKRPFTLNKVTDVEVQTASNIANWMYWVRDDGKSGYEPFIGNGSVYPRGKANVIFQDGMVWGGFVQGESLPKVGGQTYNIGTQPGWIVTPGTATTDPVPIDPSNSRVQIYRIRKDFESLTPDQATVIRDASELNGVDASNVTTEMAQAVIDNYAADWANWPGDLGAPFVDMNGNGTWDPGVDEPGIANADQVIWFVANDANASVSNQLAGSDPIGLEMQTTIWAYNQPGATLGQMIFKKYRFINKSGKQVDSMFIAQWSDPDVGSFSDDLAGNDRARSLGFAYTGFLTDDAFARVNSNPACAGYDFFQGPIVETGDPNDVAIFDLKKRTGFKNLPMTSFGFFAAGSPISDPALGVFDGTLEWYNLLNGFIPTTDLNNPSPFIAGAGPNAGQPTKFPLDGDPFRQTGDIDAFGTNLPPGDRRIVLSSGPFTLAPGDTQEVTVAVVGGVIEQQGGTNRNAVEQMKLNDDFAQFIFNNLFEGIPKPPVKPIVKVTPIRDEIALEWGSDPDAVAATEADDPVLGFNFEGYNVYQFPNKFAGAGEAKKIATFDKSNFITIIRGKKFVPEFGDIVEVPIESGTDSGIQRNFVITKDFINDRPLRMGTPYYFAVTAYNFNPDPTVPEPSLESALDKIEVIPQDPVPGTFYNAKPNSDVEITHPAGASDGVVSVKVVDPAAVTGHNYEVFFTPNADSSELLWNVRDVTANKVVIQNKKQASSLTTPDIDQPIADGLKIIVTGPALNFKNFQVVANANGPLDPPEGGALDFDGFPSLRPTDRQQVGDGHWAIHTGDNGSRGSYSAFIARTTRNGGNWPEIIPYDFEWRFVGTTSWVWDAFITGNFYQYPFELWNIGIATPDDPSDDYRMFPIVIDFGGDQTFNLESADHSGSGALNDPFTDWVYWYNPTGDTPDEAPGDAGYQAIATAIQNGTYDGSTGAEVMARMVLINWNGGTAPPYNQDLPEDGTIFRITSTKPNTEFDVFAFTAPSVTKSNALAKADVQKVNVFPNPYYASNSLELNRFNRFVTFTHLPKHAEIRIFNLAGIQVRKLNKSDDSQFFKWDLKNEKNLPVASGMYIARINMPDQGVTKVLKLMIIQGEQILEFF